MRLSIFSVKLIDFTKTCNDNFTKDSIYSKKILVGNTENKASPSFQHHHG